MLVLALIGIVFIPLIDNIAPTLKYLYPDLSKFGAFGDYLSGVVGTILTIISIYLLWKTYTSQKDELKKQKEFIAKQTQVMEQQAFEQTFFAMLNCTLQELSAVRTGQGRTYTDFTYTFINNFATEETGVMARIGQARHGDNHNGIIYQSLHRVYAQIYKENQSTIDYLVSNVFNLISWIDLPRNYPASLTDKNFYVDALKHQLKNEEICVIALSTLSTDGSDDGLYTTLLKRYGFVESIHITKIPQYARNFMYERLEIQN